MSDCIRKRVLVVDDETSNILALRHILSSEYTVFAEKDSSKAIEIAIDVLPDVILLDIVMPDMDGYEVMKALKSTIETKHIPVIFITGLNNPEDEEKGLALGAVDYISKPFNSSIVKLRVQNQVKMMQLLKELCSTDKLTGIFNRRGFDDRIKIEWNHAKRNRTSLGILMVDIDYFKLYNDTYGHIQGDIALSTIANIISEALKRSTDFASRWGGEEFAVLLPNTDIVQLRNVNPFSEKS